MAKYGLIGKKLEHSFSIEYFRNKFRKEERRDTYENIELESEEELKRFIDKNAANYKGFNVTSPYKEAIIPLLDRLDNEAKEIGAVNTVKVSSTNKLIGYNTDHYGFALSLSDSMPIKEKTALILGTGGASKSVAYVLETLGFDYKFVSRNGVGDVLRYEDITTPIMASHYLIINSTPLGTYPDVLTCPSLPYQSITKDHFLFDLVYNPSETEFLKRGFVNGAKVCNGLSMLEHQAKKAWSIWQ